MKSHSFKKIEPRKCSLNLMIIGMAFIVVGEFLNFISSFVKYRVDIYVSFCFILGAILFVIFAIIFLNSVDNTLKCLYGCVYEDAMTGVYNRNGIKKIFKDTINKEDNFFVMSFDLDETKIINDNFGHLVGDEYIISAARAIKEVLGAKGVVGRTGGDEFAAIYISTDQEELKKVKTHINKRASEIFNGSNINISMGFSTYKKDGKNMKELFDLADKRMYQDKKNKRKADQRF
ncbi:diguanylate cyclase (GGDEF)-like protein [Clostridium acetobutylicum]|nr:MULTISPECIES: GGDEF domain-containing protein [Clostridium]NOV90392.1 diguanylate cyclase (GGDEF)-like protein [Clostridium acetobutylicum]NOW15082.1 diguanylate cyclase (GGDEF)-like protein [Clostridium acetobutylicum]NRY56762.1 diguanylate cyclase (GGDEF)-like protein [Clostridium acetobutylicum]NSA93507.1 diguanylate cyclase (GGDEF)-like protein [Clostridium acetobutylicum]